ncbi:unnamed protein product [Schistosoma curassoni]|uniref:Ovule protein n=1 Tax=Schistosoma curassoni TaxID=6186 RepID=A0A183JQG6_9TREM|nr:unnamed protein product [Schistosoma curassoni]
MLPEGFDLVLPSFTVRDVTTWLSGPQLTFCMTEMYLQLIDHLLVINVMCIRSFLVKIKSYRPSSTM